MELDEVKKSNRVKTLENYFGTNISEDLMEDFTKQPIKILKGHKKAVREMAYSEKHKIIVVGSPIITLLLLFTAI